ncbi:hypothetical protein [Candidatus Palauibacter sp.]|uniref:hypothetical protein n=1 Tax=Candidatus Palauibacter sp. TaxID=3101350 RepID=UPI003B01DD14
MDFEPVGLKGDLGALALGVLVAGHQKAAESIVHVPAMGNVLDLGGCRTWTGVMPAVRSCGAPGDAGLGGVCHWEGES